MNTTYRTVWNAATSTWTAVAETARSHSKGSARAALSAVAAVVALGAPFGTATAAEACTSADEQASTADSTNTCTLPSPSPIGAQSRSITPTATLDDAYIKVLPATTGGTDASASGTAAVAIGNAAVANGTSVLAFGSAATATSTGSMAFGRLAAATSSGSIAIGNDSTATGGTGATAFGNSAVANGTSVLAVGSSATATGTGSVALGRLASATANSSTALGNQASVLAAGAVALGNSAGVAAGATNSVAIGSNASVAANVTNAMALGTNSTATLSNTISVGSSSQQRQIVNMAAGKLDTDAVNVDQLKQVVATLGGNAAFDAQTGNVTGPTYNVAGGAQQTVGDALGALDGALTTANDNIARNASDIATLGGDVSRLDSRVANNESSITQISNDLNSGAIGLVQQAGAGAELTVGANTNGGAVNFAGTAGERTLTGIANGDISAGSNDAVTGDQLYATNQGVAQNASGIASLGTQVTNLDGRVTTNETNIAKNATDITTINSQLGDLSSGTIGLVQQAGAGADLTVGANTDGAAVNFAGTTGERTLTGLANGDISAGSKDAVTGDQLYATNQGVAQNASGIASLGTQVTNLDGRVTTNETNIAKNATDITTINNQLGDLSSGTIGLVQQAGAGADLTVGANTDGAAVNFTGTAGERKLTGLANGDVAAGSTDAVTGDQLNTTNASVANLDQRVTSNETSITQIRSDMNSGTIGLVQQASTGADLTVGANTNGAAVNFSGTAGERKLTGIANGDVAAGSHDAVTGDQLHSTNQAVAQNASDIADNRTDITTISNKLDSGQIGLAQQDPSTGAITVGAATGGSTVNFAGTGGARTLSGVANGVNDDDAVTIAQLKATGLIDYTGKEISAMTYDDISLSSATLGGVGGTALHNVAPGLIASGSMDAVNGGQLHAMQQDFESRFSGLDDRVSGLESGGVPGDPGNPGNGSGGFDPGGSAPGSVQLGAGADASGGDSTAIGSGASASSGNGTAIGSGSNASGSNATAIGQGSSASGSNGTAIGQGSNASGSNSVALGAGSVADRDNAVSVGSAGNERQITNVAAGTAPTDAVNVQQMQNSVRSARQDAMGGVAAAMAVAGLPQSTQPGRTFVAMAGSTYGGEYGSALGVSYMTRDGKWTIKASANTSSRGTVGAVVGGGFYW
ncbi:ESPR-type extended signal peptide-containing protein [Burkholderia sp. IT-111MI5]|uniref:ESPR-type extended signal peptide-containing protein n=1 Tax=Burkholderia sp. IT-111MI5 TaxID=3026439 RepID=UPI002A2D2F2A|nr:YadA-like family protein [Burkholderia pyrrocinia]EKS9910823.1 YadA-like family protein [Burkholderia pyrrocinia]